MSEPNATLKLNLSELETISNALVKDTELQLFMEETIQKLHEMKQRQIDEDLQQVTNGFCAPGVNCE
tara:strand:- start:313 stop:513 length:201 start_codon:yes stop_codon:yes gene_type:complete